MNYPGAELRGIDSLGPLTLGPFPPEGAREGVESCDFPAPAGGRMSRSDRKGAAACE